MKSKHKQKGFLDPVTTGAIISAGAGLIGGIFGESGASARNKAQIAEARRAEAFQERMSSTAHQREVLDLRAAGLNPILSATGGSGATTPSGAQAQIQDTMQPAISSALQASRLTQELKNMRAAQENIKTDTALKKTQRDVARVGGINTQAQTLETQLRTLITKNAQLSKSEVQSKMWDLDYQGLVNWMTGSSAGASAKQQGQSIKATGREHGQKARDLWERIKGLFR